MISKNLLLIAGAVGLLLVGAFTACRTSAATEKVDYAGEMVNLVAELNDYARAVNPHFGLIANGGSALFVASDYNPVETAARMRAAVEGAMAESIFYGYDMTDNERTPNEEMRYFIYNLSPLQSAGKTVLSLDYASGDKERRESYRKAASVGYIEQVSAVRELDEIPTAPINNENGDAVTELKQAKNYLVLLNPGRYPRHSDYIQALAATNYDLLIIDAYHGDNVLTPADLERLQRKPNGARRLVYAYMSVGEAEDYRTYWEPAWEKKRPDWMAEPNDNWPGAYKVKYWDKGWKALLYGSEDSTLDKILAAGFDGAFLDVVDAFDYFRDLDGLNN